jgi:hypothetical protein
MEMSSMRGKLTLVVAGYGLVLVTAVALVFARYMLYVTHPADAAAAGGMYAGGDLILEIMIGCMLLVPTFVLALVVRDSESFYIGYSKVMLGLSLTAPLSLGVISIPGVGQSTMGFSMIMGWVCMDRLFASPLFIVGFAFSRLLARFDRAKRLTLYALLIEILTLVLTVVLFFFSAYTHHG